MGEQDYLVSYGLGGYLGRFRSSTSLARDDRVVIRTPRGVEIGTVLGGSAIEKAAIDTGGDVVRRATEADMATATCSARKAVDLVSQAHDLADSMALPILFLDGEILLDGSDAILHTVHWDECDVTPLIEELSKENGLSIKVADLSTTPKKGGGSVCGAEKSGCGLVRNRRRMFERLVFERLGQVRR
jgi:cell fate regulator YaaT (PSP1 superfamily)